MNTAPRADLQGDARLVEWAIRRHVLTEGRPMTHDELDDAAPLAKNHHGKGYREHNDRLQAAKAILYSLGIIGLDGDGFHHRQLEREMLDALDAGKASIN